MSLRVAYVLLEDNTGRIAGAYIQDIGRGKSVDKPRKLNKSRLFTREIGLAHKFINDQNLSDCMCMIRREIQDDYKILELLSIAAPTNLNNKIISNRKEVCHSALESVADLVNRALIKYKSIDLKAVINYDIVYYEKYREPILEVVILFYSGVMRTIVKLDIIPYSTPYSKSNYAVVDKHSGEPVYNLDNINL